MTVTKSVLDEALERRRAEARAKKIEGIKNRIVRAAASFFIPVCAAIVIAAIALAVFHVHHGATFKSNVWYFFCKCFFPCLPFQVYFIVK